MIKFYTSIVQRDYIARSYGPLGFGNVYSHYWEDTIDEIGEGQMRELASPQPTGFDPRSWLKNIRKKDRIMRNPDTDSFPATISQEEAISRALQDLNTYGRSLSNFGEHLGEAFVGFGNSTASSAAVEEARQSPANALADSVREMVRSTFAALIEAESRNGGLFSGVDLASEPDETTTVYGILTNGQIPFERLPLIEDPPDRLVNCRIDPAFSGIRVVTNPNLPEGMIYASSGVDGVVVRNIVSNQTSEDENERTNERAEPEGNPE